MKELSLSFGHFKREDELPLTITVNGCTYQSQHLVDATKKTYFEMGKAEATLKQMPEHFAVPSTKETGSKTWNETIFGTGYNMGYEIGKYEGYEQCKHDGISKINLNTEPVEQTELSKEYDKGFTKGYEEGLEEGKKTNDYQTYKMGYEAGKKAKRYTEDDIKQLHTDMNHIHNLWYDKGYNAGKSEGYKEGYDDASIKYFDEYSVKLNDRYKNEYDDGYNDGYEQCKHDGISKKEIPGEYLSHIEEARLMGYAEGYSDAKEGGHAEGYEDGKKANGISKKEIPGEWLSRIEEARKQGYADGYKDCREVKDGREVAKGMNKYGRDEDGPCNDCKEEPGRDEDDGELIGPEHPEYDKGYYAGWEDGKNHIMQFIGNESSR